MPLFDRRLVGVAALSAMERLNKRRPGREEPKPDRRRARPHLRDRHSFPAQWGNSGPLDQDRAGSQ